MFGCLLIPSTPSPSTTLVVALASEHTLKVKVHPKNIDYHIFKLMNNKNVTHIGWPFLLFYSLTYLLIELGCLGYKDYFLYKLFKYAD